MADFSRNVRRILREAGCSIVRQGKGDHEIRYSPITDTTVPVDGKIVSSPNPFASFAAVHEFRNWHTAHRVP